MEFGLDFESSSECSDEYADVDRLCTTAEYFDDEDYEDYEDYEA